MAHIHIKRLYITLKILKPRKPAESNAVYVVTWIIHRGTFLVVLHVKQPKPSQAASPCSLLWSECCCTCYPTPWTLLFSQERMAEPQNTTEKQIPSPNFSLPRSVLNSGLTDVVALRATDILFTAVIKVS